MQAIKCVVVGDGYVPPSFSVGAGREGWWHGVKKKVTAWGDFPRLAADLWQPHVAFLALCAFTRVRNLPLGRLGEGGGEGILKGICKRAWKVGLSFSGLADLARTQEVVASLPGSTCRQESG